MAVRTAADALASCLARGIHQSECEEMVASQMVNGAYCDGTIVIDEYGKRCVSRELEDRVDDLSDADPLPAPDPSYDPVPLKTWMWKVGIGGGVAVVALGFGLWWWTRKA